MSRILNKKQQSAVKPYCKVCHDAGKSEKEYTSHFVKSSPGPEGKVVCPTLLCQSCGYCGNCGHTPKFFPTLAAQKAAEEKAQKQSARKEAIEKSESKKAAPKPAPAKAKSINVFDALDSDSEPEPEPKQVSNKVTNSTIQSIFSDILAGRVVANPEMKSSIPTMFRDAAAAREARNAAKLDPKSNEFPELSAPVPKSAPKTETKTAPKGKPQFLAALNQVCPGLKVATKMPEVHIAKPPMAKLVRKDEFCDQYVKNKLSQDAAFQQYKNKFNTRLALMECAWDSEDEEFCQQVISDNSAYNVTEYYEEALLAYQLQRAPMKASEMDWAMTNEDTDDEDW